MPDHPPSSPPDPEDMASSEERPDSAPGSSTDQGAAPAPEGPPAGFGCATLLPFSLAIVMASRQHSRGTATGSTLGELLPGLLLIGAGLVQLQLKRRRAGMIYVAAGVAALLIAHALGRAS